jgi:hypothetical protein
MCTGSLSQLDEDVCSVTVAFSSASVMIVDFMSYPCTADAIVPGIIAASFYYIAAFAFK